MIDKKVSTACPSRLWGTKLRLVVDTQTAQSTRLEKQHRVRCDACRVTKQFLIAFGFELGKLRRGRRCLLGKGVEQRVAL